MTKLQRLEKRITAAVARAKGLGFNLVAQGQWGVEYDKAAGWVPDKTPMTDEQTVCICGAIALSENPKNGAGILRAIAKKFGISAAQAASLSDGFEGWTETEGDPAMGYPKRYVHDKVWYRIGRKWRNRADRIEA